MKLKPCPVCGKEAKFTPHGFYFYCTAPSRKDCLIAGQLIHVTRKEVWNTRPIEDKLQAEIDRLRKELTTQGHGMTLYPVTKQ